MRPIDGDELLELYEFPPDYAEALSVPIPVVVQNILDMPTLDYAPVRHGEWIEDDTPFIRQRKCSICGKRDNPKTAIRGHYCWYCGAKMDAKEGER